LGNNQDNFQLHRFTTSENIAKRFRGGAITFLTHTVYKQDRRFTDEQARQGPSHIS